MKTNTKLNQLLEQIAKQHLFIDTLETQSSDRLDFHDVSVWAVKAALQAAYEAGLKAAETNTTPIHTQS
ncbi:MAG: hypothetical protein EBV28_13755 [Betaproteobacteria bacterium]|nr:hypothetical protein [Betaproteobacteria bacterium]